MSQPHYDSHYYLDLAIDLAYQARYICFPNPNVGCLIVLHDKIIALGHTQAFGGDHAEITALNDLEQQYGKAAALELIKQSEVYVTLEPCAHQGKTGACALTLAQLKPAKVIIGCLDQNPLVAGKGRAILEQAGIQVQTLNYWRAIAHHKKFSSQFMARSLPWTSLKVGMSLDAASALSNGESKWITNPQSRSEVQGIRFVNDAILTSAVTVAFDDAKYNLRYPEMPQQIRDNYSPEQVAQRQPLIVIIDDQFIFNEQNYQRYQIFKGDNQKLLVSINPHPLQELEVDNCQFLNLPQLDLKNLLEILKTSYQVNYLMVEAGATLSAAMINQGLVDQYDIFQSSKIFGSNSRRALNTNSLEEIYKAIQPTLIHSLQLRSFDLKKVSIDLYNSYVDSL